MKSKVIYFSKFGYGWVATVKADNAQSAREAATNQLIGENTPEYISEETEEIAINNVRYNVEAVYAFGQYKVYIDTAE